MRGIAAFATVAQLDFQEAVMEWLGQNWIWIALAAGAFFFMRRMGGCGMGHASGHRHSAIQGQDDRHPNQSHEPPATTFDPVSRRSVTASGTALSSVYRGRAFYFENRENRDLFETDPEKYLEGAAGAGQPLERKYEYAGERHRRHGC